MSAADITAGRENRRSRPKGYADWRPQAKTQLLLTQVNTILEEYVDYLPLTVRQVFYRLVGRFGYEKTELAYSRLAEALVRARRARLIPFEHIRDDGVVIYSPDWHADPEAFWNETGRRIHDYRRDRQAGQGQRIELWCEAAGMAPQLARVANDYSIPVFSSGGFSSLSAIRTIVDRACEQSVPTMLLHVGDHDPSGESIFEAMAADAAAFLQEDRLLHLQRLIPVRVALTAEQIDRFGLETAPPKPSDSRSGNWRGETCQLEALAPDELARIVREQIETVLNMSIYGAQIAQEENDIIELWRGLPRGAV